MLLYGDKWFKHIRYVTNFTPHVGYSESKGRLLNFHGIFSFGYFPLRITETWLYGDLANKEGICYPRSLAAQNIWQCRITMCRIGKQHWLVVYLPIWKIWKSVGMSIPNIWKHNNVPSHQPEQHFEASFDNKGHIVFPIFVVYMILRAGEHWLKNHQRLSPVTMITDHVWRMGCQTWFTRDT